MCHCVIYCVQFGVKPFLASCFVSVFCLFVHLRMKLRAYPGNLLCMASNMSDTHIYTTNARKRHMSNSKCDPLTPGLASTDCKIALKLTVWSFLLQEQGGDAMDAFHTEHLS